MEYVDRCRCGIDGHIRRSMQWEKIGRVDGEFSTGSLLARVGLVASGLVMTQIGGIPRALLQSQVYESHFLYMF